MHHKLAPQADGEMKSLDEFFRNKHRPDGREAVCKVCQKPAAREAQSRHYARVPHHMRPSRSKAMRAASIGFQDFKQAFEQQNGLCAICGKPETSRYRTEVKKLSVDHDHVAKKFRGLLCQKCNTRLAALEDVEFVELAMDYLIRTQSSSVDAILACWEKHTGQTATLLSHREEAAHA